MEMLTGQFIVDVLEQAEKQEIKIGFLSVLATNPQIVDAELTTIVAKTAVTGQDSDVRIFAQQALGVIVEKRPELADAALVIGPDERRSQLTQSIKNFPVTRPVHWMTARMSKTALQS